MAAHFVSNMTPIFGFAPDMTLKLFFYLIKFSFLSENKYKIRNLENRKSETQLFFLVSASKSETMHLTPRPPKKHYFSVCLHLCFEASRGQTVHVPCLMKAWLPKAKFTIRLHHFTSNILEKRKISE